MASDFSGRLCIYKALQKALSHYIYCLHPHFTCVLFSRQRSPKHQTSLLLHPPLGEPQMDMLHFVPFRRPCLLHDGLTFYDHNARYDEGEARLHLADLAPPFPFLRGDGSVFHCFPCSDSSQAREDVFAVQNARKMAWQSCTCFMACQRPERSTDQRQRM